MSETPGRDGFDASMSALAAALGAWSVNVQRLLSDAGLVPPPSDPHADSDHDNGVPVDGQAAQHQRRFWYEVSRVSGRTLPGNATPGQLLSALVMIPSKEARDKAGSEKAGRIRALEEDNAELRRQLANRMAEVRRMRAEVLDSGRSAVKAEVDARQKAERVALLEGQLAELRAATDGGQWVDRERYDDLSRNAAVRFDSAAQRLRVAEQRITALEQEAMGKDRDIATLNAELEKLREWSPPSWWPTYQQDLVDAVNRVCSTELQRSATPNQIVQTLNHAVARRDL
jgi:hypothetical protein